MKDIPRGTRIIPSGIPAETEGIGSKSAGTPAKTGGIVPKSAGISRV